MEYKGIKYTLRANDEVLMAKTENETSKEVSAQDLFAPQFDCTFNTITKVTRK